MRADCQENLCCCTSLNIAGKVIGWFNLMLDLTMIIFAIFKVSTASKILHRNEEDIEKFKIAIMCMMIYWMIHLITSLIYLLGVQRKKPFLLIPLMIMMMLDAFYWLGMEHHESFLKIDTKFLTNEDQTLIMYSILIKICFTLFFVFVSRQIYDQFREERFSGNFMLDREEEEKESKV